MLIDQMPDKITALSELSSTFSTLEKDSCFDYVLLVLSFEVIVQETLSFE